MQRNIGQAIRQAMRMSYGAPRLVNINMNIARFSSDNKNSVNNTDTPISNETGSQIPVHTATSTVDSVKKTEPVTQTIPDRVKETVLTEKNSENSVVEETTEPEVPTPVARQFKDIPIEELLTLLHLESAIKRIKTPPRLHSLPNHVGPLSLSELILLPLEEVRMVLTNAITRNKIKEFILALAETSDIEKIDVNQLITPERLNSTVERLNAASIIELILPELLPDVKEGTIVKWHVEVGEAFNNGAALCDIDIGVAEISYDAPDSGHICEIITDEDQVVKIGKPIAIQIYHEN